VEIILANAFDLPALEIFHCVSPRKDLFHIE